jgi:hypothetical protein
MCSGVAKGTGAASCRVSAFLPGPFIQVLKEMVMNRLKPGVGSMMRVRRKSFDGSALGQAALGLFKKLLVTDAEFVDVNFGIRIEGSTIRLAFMRGSKIAHRPPASCF